jgi:protein-L-isoaspartate O-methyltransferase
MISTDRLRHALVTQLAASGTLRGRAWIDAFAQVPRQAFLRRFFVPAPGLAGWQAASDADPSALSDIYRDTSWVTQLDHDAAVWDRARASQAPVPGTPTVRGTAPSLLATLLSALDIQDGQRVLQIGTGTGYLTALLCHRLGSDQVTTVEVDRNVAKAARRALRDCRYSPWSVVGDGVHGYADGAPYDRLVATCAVPAIPPGWLHQVRPGGLIVTGLSTGLGGGALVRLRVDEPAGASGKFLDRYGACLPVRSTPLPGLVPAQRHDPPPRLDPAARLDAALDTVDATGPARRTAVGVEDLDGHDFGMALALAVPEMTTTGFQSGHGSQRWLLDADGAWACLDVGRDGGLGRLVGQHGGPTDPARRLWDEVEALHRRWLAAGAPRRADCRLSVHEDGRHTFWWHDPSQVWATRPAEDRW